MKNQTLRQVLHFPSSLPRLFTSSSTFGSSPKVTRPMCGPSHYAGSQGLLTHVQPWPASTTLCLCSRSPKNMSHRTLLLLWYVSLASQRRLPLRFDVLFCPRYVLMVWKRKQACRHPTCSSFPLSLWCCQWHSAGLMALLLHEYSWKKKKMEREKEGTHANFFDAVECLLVFSPYITV